MKWLVVQVNTSAGSVPVMVTYVPLRVFQTCPTWGFSGCGAGSGSGCGAGSAGASVMSSTRSSSALAPVAL